MQVVEYEENKIYSPRSLFDIASTEINKSLVQNIIKKGGDRLLNLGLDELEKVKTFCWDVAKMCQIRHNRHCKEVKEVLKDIVTKCSEAECDSEFVWDRLDILLPFVFSGVECHIAHKSFDNCILALQRRRLDTGVTKEAQRQIIKKSCITTKLLKDHYQFVFAIQSSINNGSINQLPNMEELLMETTRRRIKGARRIISKMTKNIEKNSIIHFTKYLDLLGHIGRIHKTYKKKLIAKYGCLKSNPNLVISRIKTDENYRFLKTTPTPFSWKVALVTGS